MSLVEHLKAQMLDKDAEDALNQWKRSGYVTYCKLCGDPIPGIPLGAVVSNPICDDCLEEEIERQEFREEQVEAHLPPIGHVSQYKFETETKLIVPKEE